MPIRLRKLCAIVLIAAYSSTALAGLQDALEGMFMATATTPAAYSSQTRGGFVGGGVGVRMPVRNINLVTFDPPRFSAGCGGIDLYGGSFSFINADQLAALFRQIAANAAGALFKLAIDSINPQLGKIMEDFQNKIQQLNSLFKNTCQIANQVVQTFASPDARSTQANNSATLVESAKGAVTDIFDSIGKIFSSPNSQARASAADNPSGGNLVWKALAQTNAGQWLGNPAAVEGNLVRANEIIMSLTGTVVMPGGQADTTDAGTGKVKPETGTVFASTLTLADLREGSTAGTRVLQILSCGGDTDCMAPSSATIAFDGTVGHVNRVLFGDPTGANAGAQSDSLISNLKSCTTATCFTAAQRSFINAVIVHAQDVEDRSAELTEIISTMEIERQQDVRGQLIYDACKRFPSAVSDGLLARVLAGRTLFYGADDMLASAGLSLEDDALLQIALAETPGRDNRADAAASVLGPWAAGCMIDALSDVATRLRDANCKYDKAASDRYQDIQARISHVPGASLVAAVQARSAQANNEQMALLAELLSRHPDGDADRGRPFDTEDLTSIRALAEDWGNRMLASGNAERRQEVKIAVLASHAPDVSLLPLLKRLLDDNLRRYRAFREEAEAVGWCHGNAVDEARWPRTHEYQRAFLAIDTPETAALMREYLADPHFGELAAGVLASQWMASNEPPLDKPFFWGVDFSRVSEKRAARAADPAATSAEAEAIFAAIESLISDDATDDQKKHAAALGIVAVRLPHGQRDATIEKLITLTPRSRRSKLLLNLILSGAEIDSGLIADGIADTLEAANEQPWMLTQNDGYELREWLTLLPFTNRPAVAHEVVRSIPDAQRQPHLLEGLVANLAKTPSKGSEEVLFRLAEEDPRFYQNHQWRTAALKLGTTSAARHVIDLTVNGTFDSKSLDDWHWSRELGVLIAEFPEVRGYVYGLLKDGVTSRPLALLARAVSENPDTEGLLQLVDIENQQQHFVMGWHAIESVVTEHVPIENWSGAYNVVPVPAIKLREELLKMTTDGGPMDAAARCLRTIDAIRDEHGAPLLEPRHPDLTIGKPWPIMTPDPSATAD